MKSNIFKTLCCLACCLVCATLTGCRTASPKTASAPTYGGLMSGRGIVPPAYSQHRPAGQPAPMAPASVEPLPPTDEPLFVSGDEGFSVPDVPEPVEFAADEPAAPAPAAKPAAPAAKPARELPHLENGRAVPNLPGAPANRRGSTAEVKPAAGAATATAAPVAGNNVYVVKKGDSLSKIAKAHGVKSADILALNPNVKSADKIMVGQSLKMPASATGAGLEAAPVTTAVPTDGLYTVAKGDSLWSIGKRFGVKREDIKAWNNLTSDKLKVGQQLRLKADATQPAAKPAPAPKPAEPAPAAKPAPAPKPAEPASAPVPAPAVKPAEAAPAAAPAPVETVSEVPAPPVEPPPVLVPAPTSDVSIFPYTVVLEGETLESIAAANGVTVESILEHNPQVKSNADIVKGMDLILYLVNPAATPAPAPAQP